MTHRAVLLSFVLAPVLGILAVAQQTTVDWPQWQGPNRTGLSSETGLLAEWPSSGPPRIWRVSTLGAGYGSVAVQGERVFVQGSTSSGGKQQSTVHVLNRVDGKNVWSKVIGPAGDNDRGPGPRGTPTLDG